MLRDFLYLDEAQLARYLGVLEGGLSDETLRRTREGQQRSRGGSAKLGPVSGNATGGGEHSLEDERRFRDTPEQRFDRLMQALDADPDRWRYEEVLDLADAWDRLTVGSFISVDCEVEIPGPVRTLANGEELTNFIDMVEAMRPIAGLLGQDTSGLPSSDLTGAMRDFAKVTKLDLVVVGEADPDSPKVVGKLKKEHIRAVPEGEVRLVGKVTKRWDTGQQHSLLALPGASLLNRAQRRQQQPASGSSDDETTLEGPALTLELLAIFR